MIKSIMVLAYPFHTYRGRCNLFYLCLLGDPLQTEVVIVCRCFSDVHLVYNVVRVTGAANSIHSTLLLIPIDTHPPPLPTHILMHSSQCWIHAHKIMYGAHAVVRINTVCASLCLQSVQQWKALAEKGEISFLPPTSVHFGSAQPASAYPF